MTSPAATQAMITKSSITFGESTLNVFKFVLDTIAREYRLPFASNLLPCF